MEELNLEHGRQKSASHQSSELSNFSICQRKSGGRALASVFSSDCISTTHEASVTAPSGTINLSLWEFQQRWRARGTRLKMGHFEVDMCSIDSLQTHFSAMKKKVHTESPAPAGRWSGWFADLPDRCSNPTSQSFLSYYPPACKFTYHRKATPHWGRWRNSFLSTHLFRYMSFAGCATENREHTHIHTYRHTHTFHTSCPFL